MSTLELYVRHAAIAYLKFMNVYEVTCWDYDFGIEGESVFGVSFCCFFAISVRFSFFVFSHTIP